MASISRSRGRLGRRFFDRSRRHIGDRVRRGRGVAACPRCLNAAGPRRGRRERSVFWLKRSRIRGRPGDLLLPNHQSRKQASTSTVRSDRRRSPSAGHAHRFDAEVGIDDVGDKGPEHDEGRVGDVDNVEHAEGDRHPDRDRGIKPAEQQAGDDRVGTRSLRSASLIGCARPR